LKKNNISHIDLIPWVYTFSWTYTKQDILDNLAKWPDSSYVKIKILESRWKYDIDNYLTENWIIDKWEYLDYISDKSLIQKYIDSENQDWDLNYPFLSIVSSEILDNSSLDWFLYPDTYYVDPTKNMVDQLVYLQLKTFKEKIWNEYWDDIQNFNDEISSSWFDFQVNVYDFITIASLIENEEKVDWNKSLIAWIILNRLETSMSLWLDVTLCYGLEVSFSNCNNYMKDPYLTDGSNSYNTRKNKWLTPTPISTPAQWTISSLLNFKKSDYYYYLHDLNWKIYPAKTYDEHLNNKSKYLK
jgi:UPF0755 protein